MAGDGEKDDRAERRMRGLNDSRSGTPVTAG